MKLEWLLVLVAAGVVGILSLSAAAEACAERRGQLVQGAWGWPVCVQEVSR